LADVKQSVGLQTIFAIFLGLMVTAFVGVGVYTFYPSPQAQFNSRILDLNRQEQAIRNSKSANDLTPTDRAKIQELADELNKTQDAAQASGESWGRKTSIILIAFATLAMAISLVRAEQLPVISNGLLLGGVFTMVYGVGWIIATGTSTARFIVMTFALAITLALGYVRFVRRRVASVAQIENLTGDAKGLVDLEQRLRGLEQRMDDAATALGHKADRSRTF
jgi:uncharacterized protein HemX